MTPAELQTILTDHRVFADPDLFVTEQDGVVWATDTYWLTPYEGSVVEALLAWWNLEGEGAYKVGRDRVWRVEEADLPKIGDVPTLVGKGDPMTVRRVGGSNVGRPVLVEAPLVCAILNWTTDNEPVFVRRDYLRIVAGEDWAEREYLGTGAMSAVSVAGGLVMPVRVT